ncbi:MAG: cation-transporting P-type ATPase [Fuerstiella sp.]
MSKPPATSANNKQSTTRQSSGEDHPQAALSEWHALSVDQAVQRLQTDVSQGLTAAEASRRLSKHGSNTLAQARQRSTLRILVSQFLSLIVALLLAATAIAFAMGDNIEAVAILVVIVINAAIGFLTEWKAQQALTALQKQSVSVAQVIRGGTAREIPAAELVPGDLVVLAAGGRVPADGRIVESVRLQIEESALTGESNAVTKSADAISNGDAALADRLNMAFLGTTITDGRGKLIISATGAKTEVGKIGLLIDDVIDRATPLEEKLAGISRLLVVIILALCGIIVFAGWLRGLTDFWHMLEIGVSLAIAAVPEGLPAVATMTLALGMQRMARQRALVRRLPAVETLGSTTVICTDKTGTLTKNEMTVSVYVLNQHRVDVTGTGYATVGTFQEGPKSVDANTDKQLQMALRIGMLCNDAEVERVDDHDTVLGDPTEAAMIVVAEKAGMSRDSLMAEFPRIAEVPFDSSSKRMVTIHRSSKGPAIAFVKGAPGTVLAAANLQMQGAQTTPLTDDDRNGWVQTNNDLAGSALRVLGLAFRELPENYTDADFDRYFTFVGLVGMTDPLRDEAKAAIATCREAGIRTVMITGDQQVTAAEIARQLGLDRDREGRTLKTVHGRELSDLDADGWKHIVADAAVFARVSPEHKLRIVEALQELGHVVAMTGDGVNDAPALKQADIGIAMGINGTEVAKENADMVITDDDFTSIVGAVQQGRIIYGNILRFLHYLLSCNLSEILTVFIAMMIGWPLPLVALQILWLNLVTDVFPAFALALEPSAPDVMTRPPRDPQESLLTLRFIGLIVWQGVLLTAVTLFAFAVGMHWHGTSGDGLRAATTMAFMTLALSQVFHAFNARSQNRSAFTDRLFTNGWLWAAVALCLALQAAAVYLPLLQRVLHTAPPTLADWAVIAGCSLLPVAVVELVKLVRRFGGRKPASSPA